MVGQSSGAVWKSRWFPVLHKPVLNWANVCLTNILRTLRRTMIRFLIELLVRRIWFGQSELYFILNWLWDASFGPNLRQTRSRQHNRKCRLKSSQYTFISPHRVIQLTTISFWVSETSLDCPNHVRRTKSSIKKRIIVRRTVRSMFGEQTFAQLRTGLKQQELFETGRWAGLSFLIPPSLPRP